MNANKLPKWKKFLKWAYETNGGVSIKDAINSGIVKNAKEFHNLLYIIKKNGLITYEYDNGEYYFYVSGFDVEDVINFNVKEDSITIEAYKHEIEKLSAAANQAEKLRIELQIANHANSYLQETIDKLRAENEKLKKQYACIGDIDANLKNAYRNVAKAFSILGNTIC